jgi:hypothetical protein
LGRWESRFARSATLKVSNRVGLIADIPDMAAWQELTESDAGADAMKFDGVRPETLVVLTEG